jgi:hypothetical protein
MKCFKPYDVFISHAAEDKIDLADEIVQSLRQSGLRVWYSSDQLLLGENIPGNIQKGLQQCRYGVIILSQHALKSKWIIHEVYSMVGNSHKNKIIIIPIWHNVTSEQVKLFAPSIADIYSLSTNKGLDFVIPRLKAEIKSKNHLCTFISFGAWIAYKNRQSVLQFFIGGLALVMIILIYLQRISTIPPDDLVEREIQKRIHSANSKISEDTAHSNIISIDSIVHLRELFDQQPHKGNRHAFEFSNGIMPPLRSIVSLKRADIPIDVANVNNAYGFDHFTTCLSNYSDKKAGFYLNYFFINNDSVLYEITNTEHIGEYQYQVTIAYTNFIRVVNVSCSYYPESFSRFEKIKYVGLSRKEKIIFEERNGEWKVTGYY